MADVYNPMAILLTANGYKVQVDDDQLAELAKWVWHGIPQSKNRLKVRVRGYKNGDGSHLHRKYLHRIILSVVDPKIEIDHINGDTLDNRRANLRILPRSENQRNRGPNRNNTSGFKGVVRFRGKWAAQINIDGKHIVKAGFFTAEDAAREFDRLSEEHHKEFGFLNFPKE